MRRWRATAQAAASLDTVKDATDQQGEHKVAATIVTGAKDAVEADVARGAERANVAVCKLRMMVKASRSAEMTVPPFNTPRSPSM